MPGLAEARVVNGLVQDLMLKYDGPKDYIATRVMPVKTVPLRANSIAMMGKEMKRRHDTRIVPKQTKKFIDFNLSSRVVTTEDRAAHYWLSDQEIEEWQLRMESPDVIASEGAMDEIYRDLEAEVAAFVFNVANWSAGNQSAEAAAWANIAFDLPARIDTIAAIVETDIGIDRAYLSLVAGGAVWPWIRRNTLVRQACAIALGIRDLQSAPLGYITPAVVAEALGIKEIIVGREFIATDLTPPTYIRCWDDDAALMCLPENVNKPVTLPFGYLCRREGHPKPYEPWRDTTREGNPMCYDAEDCISPNLFEYDPVGDPGVSECGFYVDNAV